MSLPSLLGHIEIRNPHSILEALKERAREVTRVRLPPEGGEIWKEIEKLCEKHHIKIDASSERKIGPSLGHRVQSLGEATIKPKTAVPVEQLLKSNTDEEKYALFLACDCIQDPQNLGAIFRIAAFFGVNGIILTTERSAPVSGVVYDVASGGVEHVPFSSVVNLKNALEIAKEREIWVMGTSEHARESLYQQSLDRSWILCIGNEEKGLRRLTEEACDLVCAIPAHETAVKSLNVSVATGIAVSWLKRPLS